MNDKQFNDLIDSIQEKVSMDVVDSYGPVGFERWENMKYNGRMENGDGIGRIKGKCGDTMEIFLLIENDQIIDASFCTDGCGSSRICGSFAAELALDKSIEEIFDLTGEDVLKRIGRFPKDEQHCAYLAIKTVQEAANDYMVKKVHSTTSSDNSGA